MITEITQSTVAELARRMLLMNEGKASPQHVSMAKTKWLRSCRNMCRDARQILGGMGYHR